MAKRHEIQFNMNQLVQKPPERLTEILPLTRAISERRRSMFTITNSEDQTQFLI